MTLWTWIVYVAYVQRRDKTKQRVLAISHVDRNYFNAMVIASMKFLMCIVHSRNNTLLMNKINVFVLNIKRRECVCEPMSFGKNYDFISSYWARIIYNITMIGISKQRRPVNGISCNLLNKSLGFVPGLLIDEKPKVYIKTISKQGEMPSSTNVWNEWYMCFYIVLGYSYIQI